MVPDERIELPTFGLQNRCTTAVLIRRNCSRLTMDRRVPIERQTLVVDSERIELSSAPCKGASFPLAYEPNFGAYPDQSKTMINDRTYVVRDERVELPTSCV
jgi:hypothetical protein